MSKDCTLSPDVLAELCKNEARDAALSVIPGIGPPIAGATASQTPYEKALDKELGDAQSDLDKSVITWRQGITEAEYNTTKDLNSLIDILVGSGDGPSLITEMIATDIEPLTETVGYVTVLVITIIILVMNLYVVK